jgi:hypothetical protein
MANPRVLPDMTDSRRRANRRLGLILGSVALLFFLGFMAKMMLLGR